MDRAKRQCRVTKTVHLINFIQNADHEIVFLVDMLRVYTYIAQREVWMFVIRYLLWYSKMTVDC